MRIKWVRAAPEEAQAWCAKGSLKTKAGGCYQKFGDTCVVVAPDPAVEVVGGKRVYRHGQWGALGHEVKHCFDGYFHD